MNNISIVIPAKNEGESLRKLLPKLRELYQHAEIIVVDDGSTDRTVDICNRNTVKVISHSYSMGNGAAIKSGARSATGDILVFMDGDGQHNPEDISCLLEKMDQGFDMVVGARKLDQYASPLRKLGNRIYNRLASYMTGHKVEDLTSGFRAAKRQHFIKFLYLLPNGFSYPTTSTMAFFRSALPVGYAPITVSQRQGRSHLRIFKDGMRFFIIILKIGTLFSPMRLFLPISVFLFIAGISYYAYTYTTEGRFTNMSALVLLSSLMIFLMGILAELTSSLHYKGVQEDQQIEKRD